MAQEVYLKLIVQDGDVDTTTKKLQTLGHEVDNVGNKGKDIGTKFKGGLDGAKDSAKNLEGGLSGVGKELGNISNAAKVSGAAMRSALVSTGVGALIIALGYVVENWEKITRAIGISTASIEEQIELLNSKQKLLDGEISNLDKQLKLLKLQGKSNEEIQKQKIALIEQQRELNKSELQLLETQLARLESTSKELSLWEQIKGAVGAVVGGAGGAANVAADIAIERQKEIDALREKINAVKGDLLTLDISEFQTNALNKAQGISRPKNVQSANELGDINEDPEVLRQLALTDELERIQLESNAFLEQEANSLLERNLEADAKRTQREQELSELRKQIARDELNAKLQVAQNVLGAIGGLLEENSAVAKGVAVAQATINTFQGVTAALSAQSVIPDPFGAALKFANAIAVGIAGIANVRKILQTKPIENKAPSLAGGGGGGVAAPSFNVVGTSGQNQIAQTLAERDEQPIQAYVVGSNVTSQQALDRNIQDTATIG